MYHMYPYMYRNFRSPRNGEHESVGQHTPFKRGDLEGYVAAKEGLFGFASAAGAGLVTGGAVMSLGWLFNKVSKRI